MFNRHIFCATQNDLDTESSIRVREDSLYDRVFGSSVENRKRTVTNIVNLVFYDMVEKSQNQQGKHEHSCTTHTHTPNTKYKLH